MIMLLISFIEFLIILLLISFLSSKPKPENSSAETIREVAYMRLNERKRIIALANSVINNFPEEYRENRKRYKIALNICNKFYEEVKNKLDPI